MERTMWSDQRLDDRFNGLDARLDRVDADIRDLRTDIGDLRQLIFMLWGPTMLGIFATIVAVVIRT
jgi:hypothetical protein